MPQKVGTRRIEREQKGDYEIRWSTRTPGACAVFGPGISKRGSYVPPDEDLIRRYEEEGNTRTLNQYIKTKQI